MVLALWVVVVAIELALALVFPRLWWLYAAAVVIGAAAVVRLWWWGRHYVRTWQ